jgi:hypothetical protein
MQTVERRIVGTVAAPKRGRRPLSTSAAQTADGLPHSLAARPSASSAEARMTAFQKQEARTPSTDGVR